MAINKSYFIFIFAILFVSLLFGFVKFHRFPQTRLWKGYDTLYIQNSIAEATVLEALSQNKCTNIIASANQKMPFDLGEIPILAQTAATNYLSMRDKLFSDRLAGYKLYYIPQGQKGKATKVIRKIALQNGAVAGFDSQEKFPWISPICVLVALAILQMFSRDKITFAILSIMPCVYSFCFPFYICCVSATFLIFAMFLVQKALYRPKFFSFALHNVAIMFFLILPCLFMILSGGFDCFLFFFLMTFMQIALCYILRCIKEKRDSKHSFVPIYIFSAFQINAVPLKLYKLMIIPCLVALSMFSLKIFASPNINNNHIALNLPAPIVSNGTDTKTVLPNFFSYAQYSFMLKSLPYRKLNSKTPFSLPQRGDCVEFPVFTQENDKISVENTVVLQFNNDFINDTKSYVAKLDYPAIEKMLMAQDNKLQIAFTHTLKPINSPLETLVLLVMVLLPSILYLLKRKRIW